MINLNFYRSVLINKAETKRKINLAIFDEKTSIQFAL